MLIGDIAALASLDKPLEFRRGTPTTPTGPVTTAAAASVDVDEHARRVRAAWHELSAPDGTPFYHNSVTHVITWDRPVELGSSVQDNETVLQQGDVKRVKVAEGDTAGAACESTVCFLPCLVSAVCLRSVCLICHSDGGGSHC